jgi:hypothetical protein
MPSNKPAPQATESFLYRVGGTHFSFFISLPNPPYDSQSLSAASLGYVLHEGLGDGNVEAWDTRFISKRTAEKLAGRKFIIGSKRVFHMWGYYYGKKKNPYANLPKLVPFKVNFIDVSAPKVAPVTEVPIPVRSVKRVRGRVVMTPEMKAQVMQLLDAGHSGAAIAKAVGISLPSVMNIKKQSGLVKKRLA